MSGFQFLPPLSAEDYAALKNDIEKRGVQVPIEYDQDDNVLDGHHRIRACEELGIMDWPRISRTFATDAEKRTHARQLNLARRHLNQQQRRALIADELREQPERSNRQVAASLGVSHTTVAATRDDLEGTGQIGQLEQTTGADGKSRPAKRKKAAKKAKSKTRKTAPYVETETQHDRDLQMLRGVWEGACGSARAEFLRGLGYSPMRGAA